MAWGNLSLIQVCNSVTRLLCCRMREEPGYMVTREHKHCLKLQAVKLAPSLKLQAVKPLVSSYKQSSP